MAGIPILATDNRGHRERVNNGKNGFFVKSSKDIKEKVLMILKDENLMKQMDRAYLKKFSKNYIINDMKKIYFDN